MQDASTTPLSCLTSRELVEPVLVQRGVQAVMVGHGWVVVVLLGH